MPERKNTAGSCLAEAEYLENVGDYMGAIQAIHQGLCEDPQNTMLRNKREELLSIICWRC